ncbi:MAG: BspA family leucine-rich repeat surface protein, partial [Clostridiales bacterium]|nr:BspA family leucine-rich repeat surface protein [Clostridiales bacterium]
MRKRSRLIKFISIVICLTMIVSMAATNISISAYAGATPSQTEAADDTDAGAEYAPETEDAASGDDSYGDESAYDAKADDTDAGAEYAPETEDAASGDDSYGDESAYDAKADETQPDNEDLQPAVETEEEDAGVCSADADGEDEIAPADTVIPMSDEAEDTAFAVYSADDNSLRFYKQEDMPETGDTYNNLKVTAVYTGLEEDTYSQSKVPWYSYRSDITSVSVVDTVSPVSTAYWFYGFEACTSMDVAKLDISNVTNMYEMFCQCTSLTSLDVSNFDTGNVTNMANMFYQCTSLTSLDVSNFDTGNV